MDESGSMNFLVYGYMNRGSHEGETGIALYTYDALANSVEERLFIESNRSFAALEAELGEAAYVNNNQQFYLYLDGSVICVDLNTLEYETIDSGVSAESCLVSADGRFAAWQQEASLHESDTVSRNGSGDGSAQDGLRPEGLLYPGPGLHGDRFHITGKRRRATSGRISREIGFSLWAVW